MCSPEASLLSPAEMDEGNGVDKPHRAMANFLDPTSGFPVPSRSGG